MSVFPNKMDRTPEVVESGDDKTHSWVEDGWLINPAALSTVTVIALQFVCQLPGRINLLFMLLLPLCYGVSLVAIVAAAIHSLTKKRPRRAASVLLMLVLPVLVWRPLNWVVDIMHLGLTVGLGAGQIGVSTSDDSTFVAYDWSVGLAGGPNTFLVRNTTDEIALPLAQRKHETDLSNGIAEECAGKAQHLISHYYICSF